MIYKKNQRKITVERWKKLKAFWITIDVLWLQEEQKEQQVSLGSDQMAY